jgi:hypothetical protein
MNLMACEAKKEGDSRRPVDYSVPPFAAVAAEGVGLAPCPGLRFLFLSRLPHRLASPDLSRRLYHTWIL